MAVPRRRLTRPRGDDDSYFEDLPMVGGDIGGMGLPFDLSDDEAERIYAELLEKEKRRRPPGFAPWPNDTP